MSCDYAQFEIIDNSGIIQKAIKGGTLIEIERSLKCFRYEATFAYRSDSIRVWTVHSALHNGHVAAASDVLVSIYSGDWPTNAVK